MTTATISRPTDRLQTEQDIQCERDGGIRADRDDQMQRNGIIDNMDMYKEFIVKRNSCKLLC